MVVGEAMLDLTSTGSVHAPLALVMLNTDASTPRTAVQLTPDPRILGVMSNREPQLPPLSRLARWSSICFTAISALSLLLAPPHSLAQTGWKLVPEPVLTHSESGFDVRLEEADCFQASREVYCNYAAWYGARESVPVGTIGQARGTSLFTLKKSGALLTPGAAGTWDSAYISGPRTYYENGTWYLYYFGSATHAFEGEPSSIGVATSTKPGGPYTRYTGNPVLNVSQSWEGTTLYRPFLVRNGSTYYLFYNASDRHGIGVATAKSPLGPFVKYVQNPVLSGDGDPWAPSRNGDPIVVRDNPHHRWIMYYFGDNDRYVNPRNMAKLHGIGRAFSPDLLHWSRDPKNPVVTGLIRPSLIRGKRGWSMVVDDGEHRLYALTSPELR